LASVSGTAQTAFAILAFSGMRIGELEQLHVADVLLDRGELGMFHIRRGGSNGTTKDKDERFVPIHPRIRPMIDALPRTGELLLPGIKERQLLAALKKACRVARLTGRFKLHSFRHHFASLCANHHVAYRKALAWLGHSSSDILELYYHLHDEESEAAMRALAQGNGRDGR
jgi:integrase/recombinase XerD